MYVHQISETDKSNSQTLLGERHFQISMYVHIRTGGVPFTFICAYANHQRWKKNMMYMLYNSLPCNQVIQGYKYCCLSVKLKHLQTVDTGRRSLVSATTSQ